MLELTRSTCGIVRTAKLLLSTTDLERTCTCMHAWRFTYVHQLHTALSTSRQVHVNYVKTRNMRLTMNSLSYLFFF